MNLLNSTTKIQRRHFFNKLFILSIFILSIIAILPLVMIFGHIIKSGMSSIKPTFFINLPKPVGEFGGGIANAIVGTIMLVFFSSLFAIPLGVFVGIFLAESKQNKLTNLVRLSVEILQGVPSIVIGIVAYFWIVKPMGGFSTLSGSIALGIMMLPVVIRTTEETMKLVPKNLKEASLALGAPYYITIFKIILPASASGIITGVLLSIARIAGETAPLLFTAFGNPFMNYNILKPSSSLPQIIFNYAISPYEDWHALAWGASLVLIILVLTLNLVAKFISTRFKTEF